ncbi:MAG: hypothetical protein GY744_17990 [Gammaproteobacteria bacterium]|nr:hypothetical protein [Gammaproteobacteria bacterium]
MKRIEMNTRKIASKNLHSQKGVSLVVAMVMLLILSMIGISSMNVTVLELKTANSMQQGGIAMNSANESLRVGELDIDAIIADPSAYNFGSAGDSYYVVSDGINVHDTNWDEQGLTSKQSGDNPNDVYVTEYLGPKVLPGESIKVSADGRVIGGAVHTFRITTRSEAAKNAVRLVQSIYVSVDAP